MNYLAEINAFHDRIMLNNLSTGQIALWYALMHINNLCYWQEWFTVSNQVLSIQSGLSRSGILKARNELKQLDIIDFRPRGTQSTAYKMIPMSKSTQVSTQDGKQESKQVGAQDGKQTSDTINKQKTKPNGNSKKGISKEIPEKKSYVPDDLLNDAILAFIDFRKKIKAPMTDHAVDLTIKKLNAMTTDNDEKIRILNQSIMNGWKGVFPLKETDQRQNRGNAGNFYDEMKEWANEHECN